MSSHRYNYCHPEPKAKDLLRRTGISGIPGTHPWTQICRWKESIPLNSRTRISEFYIISQCALRFFLSAALLSIPLPSQALAPKSNLSENKPDKSEAPSNALSQPQNPTEHFIAFLESMRLFAAQFSKSPHAIVVDCERHFVYAISSAGETPLRAIPAMHEYFMRENGLTTLRLPIAGQYLPLLERAVARASKHEPQPLRWLPRIGRRAFLGGLLQGAAGVISSRYPASGQGIHLVQSIINPSEMLAYELEPLGREKQLSIQFMIDAIYGEAVFDQPGPLAGILSKKNSKDFALPIPLNNYRHAMEMMLQEGIRKEPELIQYLKDALIYARINGDQAHALLQHFNSLLPEHAISAQTRSLLRELPLPSGSLIERRSTPGLWMDIEHLELEALIALAGQKTGTFHDVGYLFKRALNLRSNDGGLWTLTDGGGSYVARKDFSMRGLMQHAIRAAGGVTWQEMQEIRRITSIFRQAGVALESKSLAHDDIDKTVESLEETMREAPLKIEADQEGRGEVASQDYTILDGQQRTFADVYEKMNSLGMFRNSSLEEGGWNLGDPRTWKIPQGSEDYAMSLSKMTIHELAVMLRRVAVVQPYERGELGSLAFKYTDSDMALLQAYIDLIADIGVSQEHQGFIYLHLVNHLPAIWRDLMNAIEAGEEDGRNIEDLRNMLQHVDKKIVLTCEIIRRWVKPEDFDTQDNIVKIVKHGDSAIPLTRKQMEGLDAAAINDVPSHLQGMIKKYRDKLGEGNVALVRHHPHEAAQAWSAYLESEYRHSRTRQGKSTSPKEALWEMLSALMRTSELDTEVALERKFNAGSTETWLFRDSKQWAPDLKQFLHDLVRQRHREGKQNIRLLSLGSSTGCEAYSIAAILADALDNLAEELRLPSEEREKWLNNWNIAIVVADNNLGALFKAARGIYFEEPGEIVDQREWSLKQFLREPYFKPEGRLIVASDRLRSWIRLALVDLGITADQQHVLAQPFDVVFSNSLSKHLRTANTTQSIADLRLAIARACGRSGSVFVCEEYSSQTLGALQQPTNSGFHSELYHISQMQDRTQRLLAFLKRGEHQGDVRQLIEHLTNNTPDLSSSESREAVVEELAKAPIGLGIQDIYWLRMLLDIGAFRPPSVPVQRAQQPITTQPESSL